MDQLHQSTCVERTQRVEDTVREILGDLLGIGKDAVRAGTSTRTVAAWDSLRHVEIVFALEQEFNVTLSIEEIESMMSFADIVTKLKDHVE